MSKVIVIGDSCEDVFIYGRVRRLAPDLPVPILEVESEVRSQGMAGNVAANIRSLGVHTELITNSDWSSVKKQRFVDSETNHTFMRVDTGSSAETFQFTDSDLSAFDYVVVSDYDKGFLSESVISSLCRSHPRVILDTKKRIGEWAKEAFLVKLNRSEFKNSEKTIPESLRRRMIVTLGADGAEFQGEIFPTKPVSVMDRTGAGDSFFAGLTVSLLGGHTVEASIAIANDFAQEAVQERGVTRRLPDKSGNLEKR